MQSFLDIYYQGASVLLHEEDFFELTWEYLLRCKRDNVIHTELFFDPQTHTARGVPFDTVVNGIVQALDRGRQELGISSQLIMCFLRHLSEEDAIETLNQALPFREHIIGVGLDSSEKGHPPEKFCNVFRMAREAGFKAVAHAGEEGPAEYIYTAIHELNVDRIDHGVHCSDDPKLVRELVETRMPLTVCPLSNLKLKVVQTMQEHSIVELLRQGVCVTINSDDPAYFGGYMTDNFLAVAQAHPMTYWEIAQFSLNAIEASFVSDHEKEDMARQIYAYLAQYP